MLRAIGGSSARKLMTSVCALMIGAFGVTALAFANEAPTFGSISPPEVTLNEDAPATSASVTVDDLDITDSITVTAEGFNASLIAVSVSPESATPGTARTINITPQLDQNGSTTITLRATDGVSETTTELNVTLNPQNDAPTFAATPGPLTFDEDGSGDANATINDIDGDAITLSASSSNQALIKNANITFGPSNPAAAGTPRTIHVESESNAHGTATITLNASDGTTSINTTFSVTVNSVNDAPILTAPTYIPVDEDTTITLNQGEVSVTDDDASGLTTTCAKDNFYIVSITCSSGNGEPGPRNVQIVPIHNAFGDSYVTITVTDSSGAFATKKVSLYFSPVNDPPTYGTFSAINMLEDGIGTIDIPVSDPDFERMYLTATSNNTAIIPNSGVSIIAPYTVRVQPLPNKYGTVTLTLSLTDNHSPPVLATLTVNLQSVPDKPVISIPASVPIPEDGTTDPLPFTITDPDGGSILSVAPTSYDNLVPSANVTITHVTGNNYTIQASPRPNDAGRWAVIRIEATSTSDSDHISFPVTVTKVADAPIFLNFPLTQTLVKNSSTGPVNLVSFDADCYTAGDCTDTSSMTLVSTNPTLVPNDAAHLSQRKTTTSFFFGNTFTSGLIGITTTRQIIITPTANLTGVAVINVTVNDGTGLQVTRPLTVAVISTNTAPQFVAEGNELVDTVMQEDSTRTLGFIVQDEDGDPLQVTASSSNPTLLPPGALVINSSSGNRTLNIVPAANQFGVATIDVSLTDGISTTTRSFVLAVVPVNDAPTVGAIADQTLPFNGSTGALAFAVGDIETSAGNLQVTAASSNVSVIPLNKITLGGSGANRTVQVASGITAGDSIITLNVSDDISTTSTSFLVSVVGNNLPPTISAIANQTMDRNTTLGPLSFTISDDLLPANNLTVSVITDNPVLFPNTGLQLSGNGNLRAITLKPASNLGGSARITLTVSDGFYVVPRSFLVTVTSIGQPPSVTTPESSDGQNHLDAGAISLPFTFTVADPDTPLGNLELSVISSNPSVIPPNNVEIDRSLTGTLRSLRITPLSNQAGVVTLTVVVRDSNNANANVASARFRVVVWRGTFMPSGLQLYDPYNIDGNESNNTYARAFPIEVGISYHGTVFSTSVDAVDTVDVLSLSLSKGHYRIQLDFSNADIDLYLRDNASNSFRTLAKSDNSSQIGPEVIDYVETQDGPTNRYIVVNLYEGSPGSKGYQIKVEKLP